MARAPYTVPLAGHPGQMYEQFNIASTNSPKVNGKLVMQANSHLFHHAKVTHMQPLGEYLPAGANVSHSFPFTQAQYNELYAQWVGRLRRGDASMGVTLGSWVQSRRMLVDRLTKLHRFFSLRQAELRRKPWLYRKKDLASDFLEGQFGWLPLVADIHAAVSTVCQDAIPPTWARASKRYMVNESTSETFAGMVVDRTTLSGHARMTIAAGVQVTNPNLWLASRLGVINPLTVAWDLVPWSFVVNMFVNVGQVLESLTDTVGLTLSNGSVTRSSNILREEVSFVAVDHTSKGVKYFRGQSFAINVNTVSKSRTTGAPPMPSLSFRLPNVNLGLAAIAGALVTQKVKSL